MSFAELTIAEGLTRTSNALQQLGLASEPEIGAIRSYLDGDFVVAVAGLPKTGRSQIGAALKTAQNRLDVVILDVGAVPMLPLWDVLVVVTPADRALSRVEEALVRTASQRRRPLVVAVTRAELLGDHEDRSSAEKEIERFRLVPSLGPIGIRWYFCGTEEPVEELTAFVTNALGTVPLSAHEGPARDALAMLLDASMAKLGERLAVREREYSILQDIEAQVPLAVAYAEEEVRLSRLSVRDGLRAAEEKLFEAGFALVSSATAWIARGGVGAWSDVEQPLRTAWTTLLETSGGALDVQRLRFQAEGHRIARKISTARELVGLPAVAPVHFSGSWSNPQFEKALASAAACDLGPLFLAFQKECAEVVKLNRRHADEQSGKSRAGAGSNRSGPNGLDNRRRTLIHADLEAIVSMRLEALLEAASAAAEETGRIDAATLASAMKDQVSQLRTTLDDRHAWGASYGTLIELRSWVGSRTPGHGV